MTRRALPGLVRGDHVATIRNRITVTESGCWEYGGYINPQTGYGQVGKHATTHRVMWSHANGPIPDGMQIDHLCRNRTCCNPDHLEPVTNAENARRGPGSKTHCKWGHEFTPENTIRWPSTGRRACRTCAQIRTSRYQKEAA